LLSSHSYLTPNVSLPDVATAYMMANQAQFGGQDSDIIQNVFTQRGLNGGGSGVMTPGGGMASTSTTSGGGQPPTGSGASADIQITHSHRGDLTVTVGVIDQNEHDLCQPMVLQRADPNDSMQDINGHLDLGNSQCAQFLPPSPEH